MAYQGINILIGNACDMHCPYCLQTGTDVPANRPADLEVFARMLAHHLGSEMPRRIVIWGGEPMVYWSKIKTLIAALSEHGIAPEQGWFITTNGRKMTDEYVAYANAHPIWTIVSSHDWQLPQVQWNRIALLDRFSVSAIIHRQHLTFWDFRRRYYEFEDRYGFKPRFYLHFLRANDGCSPEFYMTKADVDILCRHLLDDVVTLARLGDDWAKWQCAQLLIEHRKEIAKGTGEKCVRSDRLSVDLHGNIYACHHNFDASNICGHLCRSVIPIRTDRTLVDPRRFSASESCRVCDIFDECRGGCYLSNTHDVDCYLAKQMHTVYEAMKEVVQWRPE